MKTTLTATLLALSAFTSIGACAADNLEATHYGATVNMGDSTVTFYVGFNIAPQLDVRNAQGRQPHAIQFWTDSEAPNPIQRTYDGLLGLIPVGTTSVISPGRIPETGEFSIMWTTPISSPESTGDWGVVVGHAGYTITAENLLSFTVPLSLLHDQDGKFYYSFQTFNDGGYGATYHGFSGRDYIAGEVPEPATYGMLAGGLAVLAFAARRRRSA